MGCIQSITCKARIRRENIVVYDVCATIDQCPTRIEETSPIVLRYKTPYFKASARVVMPPIPRHETWVVGWIQACNQMEFFNTYSDLGIPAKTAARLHPSGRKNHWIFSINPSINKCLFYQLPLMYQCQQRKQRNKQAASVFLSAGGVNVGGTGPSLFGPHPTAQPMPQNNLPQRLPCRKAPAGNFLHMGSRAERLLRWKGGPEPGTPKWSLCSQGKHPPARASAGSSQMSLEEFIFSGPKSHREPRPSGY
ncbi:protein FAM78B isoform X2 [Bos mutus]|uniref:Family with sequence similarity 78 member B n=1 Tax=Bos indicus x Bos taurus TaxID=30522 RepID=A0A4W2F2R5_BOBOX